MSSQLKDNDIIDLNGGEKIQIASDNNYVAIGGARVVKADVKTSNGIIHVISDTVSVQ